MLVLHSFEEVVLAVGIRWSLSVTAMVALRSWRRYGAVFALPEEVCDARSVRVQWLLVGIVRFRRVLGFASVLAFTFAFVAFALALIVILAFLGILAAALCVLLWGGRGRIPGGTTGNAGSSWLLL